MAKEKYEAPPLELIKKLEKVHTDMGLYPRVDLISQGVAEILKWIRMMEGKKVS
jgi:hypothetical protein